MADKTDLEGSRISYLSAYWGLFPLAMTAILQPSGRICGFDPRLRAYLRGSPIVCLSDFFGLLLRFTVYFSHKGSVMDALSQTLKYRNLYAERGPLSLRSLQRIPFVRPAVFVLAITQAIKLLGCSGLPWTKTWVYCYLIPVCVFEIIPLIDYCLELQGGPSRGSGNWDINHRSSRADVVCDSLDRALGVFAIYIQWLVFFVCMKPAALLQIEQPETVSTENRIGPSMLYFLLCTYLVVIAYAPNRLIKPAGRIICSLRSLPATGSTNNTPGFLIYVTGFVLTFAFFAAFPQFDFPKMVKYLGEISILYGVSWLVAMFLADHSVMFQREVLLLSDTYDMEKNHIAFHNLLFFLGVLILSLVGYGVGFDSSGTYKPSWAGFLG
ncbi:hypothetical protein ACN38_g1428 [Penicillium nordicum]|uniref:Uncharacterized protein n=1 Tax=Penicillium nordicum TaxID=229535 RepID=A0A0M9WJV2_9EURO|nr:hypothetical protein ACN38_g1428 [Penicillium nordicum]